jgi:hypothetical protein
MKKSLLLLVLFACTPVLEGPENALKTYINYRFRVDQKKDVLLDLSGGKLRETMASFDEQEFKALYLRPSQKLKKLKVNYKNCSENECFITYTLSVLTLKEGKEQYITDIKKIARLVLEKSGWKIHEVTNSKTYINAKEAISP